MPERTFLLVLIFYGPYFKQHRNWNIKCQMYLCCAWTIMFRVTRAKIWIRVLMVSAYADLNEDKKRWHYIKSLIKWRKFGKSAILTSQSWNCHYTTRDSAINRGILSGILSRISNFVALLFECSFELYKNIHLFLQAIPSIQELFLLSLVKLVNFVKLQVQTWEKLFGSITILKLLNQFCLVHITFTSWRCKFLMNLLDTNIHHINSCQVYQRSNAYVRGSEHYMNGFMVLVLMTK